MTDTRTRITADELLRLRNEGERRELAEGEIREMSPMVARHVRAALRIKPRHKPLNPQVT